MLDEEGGGAPDGLMPCQLPCEGDGAGADVDADKQTHTDGTTDFDIETCILPIMSLHVQLL